MYKQGEIYYNLGVVAYEQKDYAAAKEYHQKALAVFVQYNDVHGQGEIYHNLGAIARDQKDYAAVREYYQKALAVFVQYNDVYSQAEIYYNLGIVAYEQKDYAAAREYYKKSLDCVLQFLGDVHSIAKIINTIYNFAKETNNRAFGQAMLQKAMPHFEGDNKAYLQKLLDNLN